MALQIKRKETVRHALRRLGPRLTGKALVAMRECDTLEAVHEVRKEIKQSRALLRLVQSGLSNRVCRSYKKKLKKTASALSPSRDAFVKTVALDKLASHDKHNHSPTRFKNISHVLAQDCKKKEKKLPGDLKQSRRLLKKICRDFSSIDASQSSWKVIGRGLRRSYRSGRRACHFARATGSPENFHEWRKSAKDLLYQIRFLCAVRPDQLKPLEAKLDKLGDFLGDGHDLAVLAGPETLKQMADQPQKELQTLKATAERRMNELHAKALHLGSPLYKEHSGAFCQRLQNYWRRWNKA